MSSRLHREFNEHRLPPGMRVWPSMVATVTFMVVLFVTWVYSLVLSPGRGVRTLADTAFGQHGFVWGGIMTTALLLLLVGHDVRRHRGPVWQRSRYVIGAVLAVLLGLTLLFLTRATTLL